VGSSTPQTSVNGQVFTTYATNTPVTVTVTPNSGYVVSQVNYNGTLLANPTQTSFVVNGPKAQTVQATFAMQKFSITASVAGSLGGTVTPGSLANFNYGTVFTAAKKITFVPESSVYAVTGITGIPAGAVQSPAAPVAGQAVTVTFPAGFTVTSNITLVGTFASQFPVAKVINQQSTFVGALVTLDGSASRPGGTGISSYSWAQVSGPSVTLTGATSAQASFVPSAAGTYVFTLTLQPGDSSATTTVFVAADANQAVLTQCQNCHAAVGSPKVIEAYTKWASSKHQSGSAPVICAKCHSGADTGLHPGVVAANICISCHNSTVAVGHNGITDTNATTCYVCHNHDLPTPNACSSCHGYPPPTKTLGVSTYTHTSSTCADCHSVPPTTAATATHRDGIIEILTNTAACSSCHSYPPAGASHATAVGGTTPNCATCHIYTGFNAATHNNGTTDFANLSCTTCHGNPPTVLSLALSGKTGPHPASSDCALCHGYVPATSAATGLHRNGVVNTLISGAPHFNNTTSGMFPASYVTSKVTTCANCHNSNANNQAIRQQWGATGHANTTSLPWIDYDFKTRAGCVQCHTTTGFITYSTAKVNTAWGTATDKTKEVLTCVGCHSDVANGVVRTVTPVKPFDVETTYQNADMGTSNICADCHSGRNNGATIQAKVAAGTDFTNLAFVSPHYLSAAGSLQGKTGYHFPGRTYTGFSGNSHSTIGVANDNATGTAGPCVACHMSETDKHSFTPVTADATGTITAIKSNVCSNCHGTTLSAATLDTNRIDFTKALAVLRAALAARTPAIIVTDNYPYVANKNWGTGQNGANLMGATFNLKLFISEPAAYVHNPEYAKQIVADSIIAAVYGGDMTTGSPDINSALAALVSAGTITLEQSNGVIAYQIPSSSCDSCHGYAPASHVNYAAAADTSVCTNCHIYTTVNSATHNNGTANMIVTLTPSASGAHFTTSKVATMNAGSTTKGWYSGSRYIMSNMSTAYVSPSDTCADCHGPNKNINAEYAQNFHSRNNRWKTSSTRAWKFQGYSSNATPAQVSTDGCVRCHTTQGYINYVGSSFTDLRAWGFREAGYKNSATAAGASNTNTTTTAVTCRACHTDANGTVRGVAAVKSFYNFSTLAAFGGKINSGEVQYSDFKSSNVCIPCHSGRNGASNGPVFDTLAVFTKYTSATVNPGVPHGDNGLQAGLLDAKIGYKFGKTYTADASGNTHNTIGVGGSVATNTTSGPCVTCHMDNASGHRDHTFEINMSALPNVCSNCHTSGTTPMSGTVVNNAKSSLAASLKALAEIMIDERLNFTGTPILSAAPSANTALNAGLAYGNYSGRGTTGTAKIRPGANSLKVKYPFSGKSTEFAAVAGAIYNLKLLNQYDNGAFAHNPGYAKWLINQSIEAMRSKTDGVSGVSVATTSVADAISKLTPNSRISATEIALAGGYSGTGTSCTTCHANPPASGTHITMAVQPGTCANCHSGATHNGHIDLSMTCSSCHPTLGGSHNAHVGTLLSSVTGYGEGFVGFNGNNSDSTGYKFGCVYCHPSVNAAHTNGTIVLNGNGYTGTTRTNITCATASCHSDGKGNFTVTPNWYTGFTGTDKCAMCHAAAPATGSHVAHTSINGIHDGSSGITYPASVTCANCHAGTVDSTKKINFVNHVNGIVSVSFATTNVVSKAQISAASFNAYSTVWTRTGSVDTSKNPLSAGNYVGGSCSTIACHNNGTTPAWGTTTKISCVDCHSAL
jgi:predicted CxxxxCH...CXXCH cytochrome family protein